MRFVLGGAVAIVLLAIYAWSERLPNLPLWGDVVWTGLVLTSLLFALTYAVLPLWTAPTRILLTAVLVLALAAAGLHALDLGLYATFPKLLAASLLGFWFMRHFERLSWVVIVALVIPFVDTLSVWRGPTHKILHEAPQAFDFASVAFPIPGERVIDLRWSPPAGRPGATYDVIVVRPNPKSLTKDDPYCSLDTDSCDGEVLLPIGASAHHAVTFSVGVSQPADSPSTGITVPASASGAGSAEARRGPAGGVRDLRASSRAAVNQLGLTDVFFFALFLAAAARFGLRVRATWLGLVAGVAATTALVAYGGSLTASGLPALPLISLGFLLPNADRLWAALKRGPEHSDELG